MGIARQESPKATRAEAGEVARQRALRDAAQRGRVQEWAGGATDPELESEFTELIAEGVLRSDVSLADQRARWAYLEAAWEAAGRPGGDADRARREIARALRRSLRED
jgi:hypothetical protein